MILGMTPLVFIHTLISLVGIVTGLVVLKGMWANQRADRWTLWFLATTIFTSASGPSSCRRTPWAFSRS